MHVLQQHEWFLIVSFVVGQESHYTTIFHLVTHLLPHHRAPSLSYANLFHDAAAAGDIVCVYSRC